MSLILVTNNCRRRVREQRIRLLVALTGQSQQIGRHLPDPVPTYANAARIFRISQTTGIWGLASDPLHSGGDMTYGVGPGMALADRLLNIITSPLVDIGLIPCALGNTTSSPDWMPTSDPTTAYGKFLYQTRKAMLYPNSRLIGIHHWQGENDWTFTTGETFKANLLAFVAGARRMLGDPNLPIILTKPVPAEDGVSRPNFEGVQAAFDELIAEPPDAKTRVIVPPEPALMPDNLHTTAASNIATGHTAADTMYPLIEQPL